MLTTYLVILVSVLIVTLAIIAGVLIILVHNHVLKTSKKNYTLIEQEKYQDVDLDAFATEKRIKKIKEKNIADKVEKKKEPEVKQTKHEKITAKKDIESDLRSRLQEELFKSNETHQPQQNPFFNNMNMQQQKTAKTRVNVAQTTTQTAAQVKTAQQKQEDDFFRRIAEERRKVAANMQAQAQQKPFTQQTQYTQQTQTTAQFGAQPNTGMNAYNSALSKKDKKLSKKELENDLQAKLLRAKSELNNFGRNV